MTHPSGIAGEAGQRRADCRPARARAADQAGNKSHHRGTFWGFFWGVPSTWPRVCIPNSADRWVCVLCFELRCPGVVSRRFRTSVCLVCRTKLRPWRPGLRRCRSKLCVQCTSSSKYHMPCRIQCLMRLGNVLSQDTLSSLFPIAFLSKYYYRY